jgi:apolipoprotein N-acyltransferase
VKNIFRSIYRFLVPESVDLRKRRLELTVWAFLLSLAYYPGYFGFIAWFALARPLMIIAPLKPKEAFGAAYLFGFLFNAFSLYWVALVTPPGTVAAVLIVALYYSLVLFTFNRLYALRPWLGIAAVPFLWVGMEYFRTLSQFAFPWSDLGYTQSYFLEMIQIVSVISVHGLSLLIMIVNVLVWQILRKDLLAERRLTSAFVSLAIVLLVLAYGWIVLPPLEVTGRFPVAVLQGSVPLHQKWATANEDYSLRLYDSLAQSVYKPGIKLYVWPETAVPSYLSHSSVDRRYVGSIARKTNAYHLVGALGAEVGPNVENHYNSCYQFGPDGTMGLRYDKVKLVPFSEHVPYQDHLPFLRKEVLTKYLTFIETYDVQWWSDFRPGDSLKLFSLPDARYAVLICFESTFPEYARKAVRMGADFLVGITNDTWFGHSVGVHMHSRIFLVRAIENRSWSIRAANSGISYIADKYGRIRHRLGLDEVAGMTGKINRLDGYSIFTRIGDIAGKASLLISLGLIGILLALWLYRKIAVVVSCSS